MNATFCFCLSFIFLIQFNNQESYETATVKCLLERRLKKNRKRNERSFEKKNIPLGGLVFQYLFYNDFNICYNNILNISRTGASFYDLSMGCIRRKPKSPRKQKLMQDQTFGIEVKNTKHVWFTTEPRIFRCLWRKNKHQQRTHVRMQNYTWKTKEY